MRPYLTTLLFIPLFLNAQQWDLEPVNDAFGGAVVFKIDKYHRLVMDLHDEQGRYRQDVVPIEHLAPDSTHFSATENAIVLNCNMDHAQCISKEIFKLNVVRATSRSTLPCPPNDPGGERTVEVINSLIKNVITERDRTANETTPQQGRMKSSRSSRP